MDVETALKFVERLLIKKLAKKLTDDEKAIIKGTWEDLKLDQIRGKYNLQNYADVRSTASKLWHNISQVVEPPTKVTKRGLKGIIEQQWLLQAEQSEKREIIVDDRPPDLKDSDFVGQTEYARAKLNTAPYQNLPPQHNAFIGREEQLCQLMRFLSADHPANILQVDGIAGVGKTALVLEAAYRCLDYRERVKSSRLLEQETNLKCDIPFFEVLIFVSAKNYHLLPNSSYVRRLIITRTLQDIYRTIARVLDDSTLSNIDSNNCRTDYFSEITNKISDALKTKNRVLMIVDNLETLEDRDKVLSFLFELPIKSIITTREQCGFKSIRLDSLSDQESNLLIEQQLREKAIDLTKEQKDELHQITGGIPMVIIWSIGRLAQGSSLQTIQDDLRNPEGDIAEFSFKTSLRDIKNTLAYKLLITLSVFKQAPNWESVVAVAGLETEPEGRIRREMETLQRLSLVRYHNGRYKMLPLTREYALAELQKYKEFKSQVLERWVQWYIDFAKREHNRPRLERFTIGYKNIEEEWENLVSVLHFCKDENHYEYLKELWSYLNNYTNLRGYWKDRLSWLNHLTDVAITKGDFGTAVSTMSRQARILLLMGQPEQLQRAKELLLKAWSWCGYANFSEVDYVLNHLAGLFLRLGEYDSSHKWLNKEQDNLNSQHDLSDQHRLRYQIYIDRERSEVLFYQKEYALSKELCNSVIEKSSQVNPEYGLRNSNYAKKILADIAIEENDIDMAEDLLKEVYAEVEHHKDKRRIAYCLVSQAKLEQIKGNLGQAKSYLSQASNHFKDLGMTRDLEKIKILQLSF
ncbi:ATP-binding protein [Spirulina subsalsa FACHB-351]|uniref:ATP-binding protein n=1 Tax=Spirulina subsalsa FACHB-351 TaxID=234711 RepID=A0ABT3L553_9CYAN|nr:ATP-binding protein [Spirulina subsalsa]MCW6036646.1 ATP-binding protein [Spirulina subsalsa FACHB-351]